MEKKTIIVIKESLIHSMVADTVSMVILLSSVWFNHEFIGNSYFVNTIILIFLISLGTSIYNGHARRFYNKEDAIKHINQKQND